MGSKAGKNDTYTKEYLDSNTHYGFNCYLMDRELFFDLCEFQFPVLFSLEADVAGEKYAGMMVRTLGYLGEIMYGIFVYSVLKKGIKSLAEKNIVLFMTTSVVNGRADYMGRWIRTNARQYLGDASLIFLPRGSKRRSTIKRIGAVSRHGVFQRHPAYVGDMSIYAGLQNGKSTS